MMDRLTYCIFSVISNQIKQFTSLHMLDILKSKDLHSTNSTFSGRD